MANRFPLIIDTADGNRIKELPNGDSLNLTPTIGMFIYNVTTGKFQGYAADSGDSTAGWVDLH